MTVAQKIVQTIRLRVRDTESPVGNKYFQPETPIHTFLFVSGFFLSRTFTIRKTAGEGEGYFFKSSLPVPLASKTLT